VPNSLTSRVLLLPAQVRTIIGGVIALVLGGFYVSVPVAVGFIAVFGVAMLNGIVLVSFIHEQRVSRDLTIREAVREGTLLPAARADDR